MKRIFAMLFAVILCLCAFPVNAEASQGQKVEIYFNDAATCLQGAKFSAYYLGSVKNGKIKPDEVFSSYKVSFDISDSEKSSAFAETVSAYILRDRIKPYLTDKTDNNGRADFNDTVFDEGAYLIMADKHYQDGNYYFCEPVVVTLPYTDSEYLIINPKYELRPEQPEKNSLYYKVLKVWINDNKAKRPENIEVELICDGKVHDTVVLSEENSWKHQWDNLSSDCHWTVTEKRVKGNYLVSLSREESVFILTNEGKGDSGSKGDGSDKTPGESPDKSGEGEKLPATGTLKWPVPYLAFSGILLIALGYVRFRKSEDGDE